MTLLICATCPRYDQRASGQFSSTFVAALRAAITATHPPVAIRRVQCLGGCPKHGVLALDDPGKVRVRFTALDDRDVDAVLEAALAYDSSESGHPDDWPLPERLNCRLSSITVKRLAV